jgi:hypothetical protein
MKIALLGNKDDAGHVGPKNGQAADGRPMSTIAAQTDRIGPESVRAPADGKH